MFPDDHATSSSNAFSDLLLRGVAYQSSGASTVSSFYSDALIEWLHRAAALPPGNGLDQAIGAVGRIMVDEFPLTVTFAPSITHVLDAQQRLERQRCRTKSNENGNA